MSETEGEVADAFKTHETEIKGIVAEIVKAENGIAEHQAAIMTLTLTLIVAYYRLGKLLLSLPGATGNLKKARGAWLKRAVELCGNKDRVYMARDVFNYFNNPLDQQIRDSGRSGEERATAFRGNLDEFEDLIKEKKKHDAAEKRRKRKEAEAARTFQPNSKPRHIQGATARIMAGPIEDDEEEELLEDDEPLEEEQGGRDEAYGPKYAEVADGDNQIDDERLGEDHDDAHAAHDPNKATTEPKVVANAEFALDTWEPIDDFGKSIKHYAAVTRDVDFFGGIGPRVHDRLEVARQQVLDAYEALQQEKLNRQLRTQKAAVEAAAKVLADLNNKLTTLRAKYKTKLETALKYLQEVVDELDSQILD